MFQVANNVIAGKGAIRFHEYYLVFLRELVFCLYFTLTLIVINIPGKLKSRGLSMFREPGPSMAILPPQIKPSEITFEVIMPIPEQEKTPRK